VTHVCFGAWDVIEAHGVASLPSCHHVSFGLALVDIVDGHGVTDEFGRRCRSDLNLWYVVVRVKGIVALSLGLELDNLRRSSRDVISLHVGLLLVEADVEGAGA